MPVPDPRRSRAVVVGIGDYTHADLAAMPAAASGANRVAALLRDPSVWGLSEDHVTTLVSGTTQERILTAVRDAALATEDTLLVYFAGHGLRDPGERLHLALADADPDFPQIGTLPYRQLRDLIRHAGHRARHRVTVLDCCYSGIAGGMSHAATPTRDELATALDEPVHGDANGGEADGDAGWPPPSDEDRYGDCVLTSAPAESRSFVRPGAPYPEFTGELIATLDAGIAGVGPLISLERVWLRVRDRMRARHSPEPQQFAHNSATRHIQFLNRSPHTRGEPGSAAPGPDAAADPGPEPGPPAAHLAARDAAERIARTIPEVSGRMSLLAGLADATATVDPGKARRLADEVVQAAHETTTDPTQRALLFARAAVCLATLDPSRARRLVDEAERAAQDETDPDARARALVYLADELGSIDRDRATWLLEEAEGTAHGVPDTWERSSLLRSLTHARLLKDAPEWRQRLKDEAESFYENRRKGEKFEEAARRSPEGTRRAGEAGATTDPQRKVAKLVEIARELTDSKHHHQAVELLEEAERTIQMIRPRKRGAALRILIGELSRIGWAATTIPDRVVDLTSRTQRAVDSLTDHMRDDLQEDLARTLAHVARCLAWTDPRRALGLAREAQALLPRFRSWERPFGELDVARTLTDIGKHLAPSDPRQAADLAVEAWRVVSVSTKKESWQYKPTSREAVEVLALAGRHLAATDPRRAEELLRDAESRAHDLPASERTSGLRAVAVALVEALGETGTSTRPDQADNTLRRAERLARDLPDDESDLLERLSRSLLKAGETLVAEDPERAALYAVDAERVGRRSQNETDWSLTFESIVYLWMKIVERRPAYANRARLTAKKIADDEDRARALGHLAAALAPADPEHAERIAEDIPVSTAKAVALIAISKAWATAR
ncbi:caspase, EACC1-associated type [Streptomyces sp. DH41]|uniref:caspase, EACC1-associated type n=1 Tax=Streptomyces sp. DH41 TaxID=3040125 RepID=UPI0024434B21|nr:caspase family protein [Streptomyces sp. DH41]MDG9722135.1 caspase family protein [Streptomyces sp. DH41]